MFSFNSEIGWTEVINLVGLLLVLYGLLLGKDTIRKFQSQTVASRRVALAEDVLALAYETRSGLKSLREQWSIEDLKEIYSGYSAEDHGLAAQRISELYGDRIEEVGRLRNELAKLHPRIQSIFGSKTSDAAAQLVLAFDRIPAAWSLLKAVARRRQDERLIDGLEEAGRPDLLADKKFDICLEIIAHTDDDRSQMNTQLDSAIVSLELELLGILRPET
jgi:hypothetical protein